MLLFIKIDTRYPNFLYICAQYCQNDYYLLTMQTLSQIQILFQQYLVDHQFQNKPQELYDPVNYILSIGGKRLRPALLLLSYQLFDEDIDKALPAAFAIEVFHNFTLLHDDIMDEAPLRRGKPTVHHKYDLNTGILSGDVMMIYAYDYLTKIQDSTKIPAILSVFNQVAIEVCEGQQYDMNFESKNDVKITEYLDMIRQKTAVLLAGGMKIGAILGNANEKQADQIYQFAENIGIAFQLQDDILDTFGDPEKFGKKVGGDIAQNKKTFLLLKAFELADEDLRKELFRFIDMKEDRELEKIDGVKGVYRLLNIKEIANKEKEKYQKKAFEYLHKLGVKSEKLKIIKKLAEELLDREI
ncbi:MAG: polyprenyl synthetase family protein [Saprospiraceae bacterium]|jgi:geranylgeranyl diphosphate synthase type II|nr:polyprenyl synthetase family protein [Saprospiraceae bacterium]